jgi:hypothetical protein
VILVCGYEQEECRQRVSRERAELLFYTERAQFRSDLESSTTYDQTRFELRLDGAREREHDIEINICVPKTGLTCLKYSIYVINCALFILSKTIVFYELACRQAGSTQFDCDVISSVTQ